MSQMNHEATTYGPGKNELVLTMLSPIPFLNVTMKNVPGNPAKPI